jgi:hypothetical protein
MSASKDVAQEIKCWNCGKILIKDNKIHLCVDCMVNYVERLVIQNNKTEFCPRFLKGTKTITKEVVDPDTGVKTIEAQEDYVYKKCDSSCGLYSYKPACCNDEKL